LDSILNEFKVEMSFKDRCMYTTSGENVRRHRFLNEVMDGEENRKDKGVDLPIARIEPARSDVPADLRIADLGNNKMEGELAERNYAKVERESQLSGESTIVTEDKQYEINLGVEWEGGRPLLVSMYVVSVMLHATA
jgi:hypothetical protein